MLSQRFVVGALATWRVTHLLAEEDGPADVVVRLRAHAGAGRLGGLMDCFYCLSVWVAAPLTVAVTRGRRPDPMTWLAPSGAACLLEQATRGPAVHEHPDTDPDHHPDPDPEPETITS